MKSTCTLIIIILSFFGYTQQYENVHILGNEYSGDSFAHYTVTDSENNIYTVGIFKDSLDIDPSLEVEYIYSNGDYDIFIQKLDEEGNLNWAKSLGGNERDQSTAIILGGAGELFITGRFSDTITILTEDGDEVQVFTTTHLKNGFVLKMNTNGDFNWIKTYEDDDNSTVEKAIYSPTSNTLVVVGTFKGEVDLDLGEDEDIQTASSGNEASFISRINAENGNYIWGNVYKSTNSTFGANVVEDTESYLYMVGFFTSTLNVNPEDLSLDLYSNGNLDVFIMHLDTDGNYLNATSFGGTNTDLAYGITISETNSIYFTGISSSDIVTDEMIYENRGGFDAYVQKMTPSLTPVWFVGFGQEEADIGMRIKNFEDQLFVTGTFFENTQFPEGETVFSRGDKDVFFMELDTNGVFQYALNYGSPSNDDIGGFHLNLSNSKMYICGRFNDLTDFDPDPENEVLKEAESSANGYVLELNRIIDDLSLNKEAPTSIHLFPNPVNDILNIITDEEIERITLSTISGKQVLTEKEKNKLNISHLSSGIYVVTIKTQNSTLVEKLIKTTP